MKAVLCHAFGEPDGLRVEEIERRDLKGGHVRIRVRAAGVNFPDRTLPFTWAGLAPAGSHQLCGWRTHSITQSTDAKFPSQRIAFSSANSLSMSSSVFHTCGVTRIELPRTET
jgi:hypothetical protein